MRIVWILILALAGAAAGYLWTRFEGDPPVIETRSAAASVNKEYVHEVRATDEGTGLESLRVWLVAGDKEYELANETYPGSLFTGADLPGERAVEAPIDAKKLGLADGNAVLHIEAKDYSWRGNVTHQEVPITIDTKPPRITLETGLTYVRRGGSEAVVYGVTEDSTRDGVEVGELWFPGFAHPLERGKRIAFWALAPGLPADARPRVVAEDAAGNRATVGVAINVIEREFPADTIQVSESFMTDKANELGVALDGGAEAAYLKINGEMRRRNDEKIRDVCRESSSERLWSGAFVQMPNTHVGARFAETRSYVVDGRKIDTQVHLGYDLASTTHAPVPAANDGVVVFSDALGIYGNTVIVDHGLGLFSLYGHLSELGAAKGDAVQKGKSLGKSGQTGLAGGDHLHYAVMLSGIFVDPLEWFDPKWIHDHLEPKLAPAAGETAAGE